VLPSSFELLNRRSGELYLCLLLSLFLFITVKGTVFSNIKWRTITDEFVTFKNVL
jgi:hypothetical protein